MGISSETSRMNQISNQMKLVNGRDRKDRKETGLYMITVTHTHLRIEADVDR
jgi:hypothetical protein